MLISSLRVGCHNEVNNKSYIAKLPRIDHSEYPSRLPIMLLDDYLLFLFALSLAPYLLNTSSLLSPHLILPLFFFHQAFSFPPGARSSLGWAKHMGKQEQSSAFWAMTFELC